MTRRTLFCRLCDVTTALEHVVQHLDCGALRDALGAVIDRLDEMIDLIVVVDLGAAPTGSNGAGP